MKPWTSAPDLFSARARAIKINVLIQVGLQVNVNRDILTAILFP